MSDADDAWQIEIPESFLALHLRPGGGRLSASRDRIAARYELCEDVAQMLHDDARARHLVEGMATVDVLRRCHHVLSSSAAGLDALEAAWVVRRLAELLGWPVAALGEAEDRVEPSTENFDAREIPGRPTAGRQ